MQNKVELTDPDSAVGTRSLPVPLGVDHPRKVAREHLMKEIGLRRDKLKRIESRGEPIPIELLVELEAFRREIVRYREGVG